MTVFKEKIDIIPALVLVKVREEIGVSGGDRKKTFRRVSNVCFPF